MNKQFLTTGLSALVLFLIAGCVTPDITPLGDDNNNDGREELTRATVVPKEVDGGKYPPVAPDFSKPLNVEPPQLVPDGPVRGKLIPLDPSSGIKEIDPNGGSQAVTFEEFDEHDDATPISHNTLPEPSVAENGNTVMTTGNTWMSLSLDAGQTFNTVNPTTIFPNDYGGLCCDQVLQYVPEYDIFVWLLQYRVDNNGVNAIRIAVQNTQRVRSSNGTAWTYWDFTSTGLNTAGMMDYNDMSFGNRFLYWTTSIGGASRRYVVRVPLEELAAKGTVNYQFTQNTDAIWSHVTQNGTDGVYWAGHVNNSTLKVYSMMDNDGFYSWRDVSINSWPNGTMSSTAADGKNWLSDASWKTYVRAAAISRNSIYFAWNASNNSNFPQTHVQIAEINRRTFNHIRQHQIWNPDFAFAYPYFETNNKGQLGMITAFGGGPYNASSGVGVWGDFVIYYPRLSSVSKTNYGHYHTVRRSASDGAEWVSAGYTYKADGNTLPYYIRFSH